MGKAMQAVSLVVKQRFRNPELAATLGRHQSLAAARGEIETYEAAEEQLEELTEFPENDDFANWMVIPTVLLPRQHSKLLPDNLQHFPSKLGYSAEDAMSVAKQVLIMIYTTAKNAADAAHVPLPPECALEEEDVRQALIWPGMSIVEPDPEDRISNLVRTADPRWVPRDQLSGPQGSIYDERAALVETAAFVYFWSKHGWMPELETEIEN